GRIAAGAILLNSAQTLVGIGVGWLLLPTLMVRYPPETVLFAQRCLACALGISTYMLMKQCFSGIGAFRQFNFANLWPQLLYGVALLLMIPLHSVSASAAILALLGTSVLATLTTVPSFWSLLRPQFAGSLREVSKLAAYSVRAAATDIVFALATSSDRLLLIPLLPAEELGIYAVAFSFSRIIQLVQPAISSVVFSHMAGQSESAGKQVHDYALRFLLAAFTCGIAVLWVTAEPLLVLAYGADFAAANSIFRLLV